MSPILQPGDHFVADKDEPWGRWDIVSYIVPGGEGMHFAGRVVGLPGETVEIIGGAVYINGQPVRVPRGLFGPYACGDYPVLPGHAMYGRPGAGCKGNPITLLDDEVFVLGDNSERARDGRYWTDAAQGHQLGALPRSFVVGKATFIYYPFSRWRIMD